MQGVVDAFFIREVGDGWRVEEVVDGLHDVGDWGAGGGVANGRVASGSGGSVVSGGAGVVSGGAGVVSGG